MGRHGRDEPHRLSEVLTGAMFDVLIELGKNYDDESRTAGRRGQRRRTGRRSCKKKKSPMQVFYDAADRMQRMAIQPLDLLPPVDVTFRDYALAVCRSQRLADPLDPEDYYGMLIEVFRKREILRRRTRQELKKPTLSVRPADLPSATHGQPLAVARRGLSVPRRQPRGPAHPRQPGLLRRRPLRRQQARPPEPAAAPADRPPIRLARGGRAGGPQFGQFDGKTTTMLCGGTLVFDDNGNVLAWAMKPGSQPTAGRRRGKRTRALGGGSEGRHGAARRLPREPRRADRGRRVGVALETAKGFWARACPRDRGRGEDGDRFGSGCRRTCTCPKTNN